jgi:hypothetical protein
MCIHRCHYLWNLLCSLMELHCFIKQTENMDLVRCYDILFLKLWYLRAEEIDKIHSVKNITNPM